MNRSKSQITLFLPDFFQLPADVKQRFDRGVLPIILGRGRRINAPYNPVSEGQIWELCGLPVLHDEDVPVGALRMLGGSEPVPQTIIACADPVTLSPNRDHLLLLGNEGLFMEESEEQMLLAELNEHFSEDGICFFRAAAKQWCVYGHALTPVRTSSLSETSGRNMREHLPVGDRVTIWNRLMTEAQMVLHASKVNQQRRHQGSAEINSLWCWGVGRCPEGRTGKFTHLYGNGNFLRGLAQLTDTEYLPLPEAFNTVPANEGGGALFDIRFEVDENQSLEAQVDEINELWLAPLLNSLKKGDYEQLWCYFGQAVGIVLEARDLKRFWRRTLSANMLIEKN